MTAVDAEELRAALLVAAGTEDATPSDRDEYGERFVLDFSMDGPAGQVRVRSTWIVRVSEDFPRLSSCYVL